MDLVRASNNIANRVQKRFSNLIVDKPLNVLIEEEIKREYQGTDQSSQGTQKNIQEDYNIF